MSDRRDWPRRMCDTPESKRPKRRRAMKEQREKDAAEAVEEIVKKFGPFELDAERIRRITEAEKDR